MSYTPVPQDKFGNALIAVGDSPSSDAFSRLRVSTAQTVFDSQQEYGLCALRCWDAAVYNGSPTIMAPSSGGSVSDASGNAVGPRATNSRMVPITVTSTNTHYAVLQTRQYFRYAPGKSMLTFITGVFAAGSGYTASITLRSSTSGSVDDSREVQQAAWNIDPLDGTGCSGYNIDFTKTQIMYIQAQWLGVGRVIVGFDIDGKLIPAHQFLNANVLTVPFTQTWNLPMTFRGDTDASTTSFRVGYFDAANGVFLKTTRSSKGGTAYFNCVSVQVEGQPTLSGFPNSASTGTTGPTVSTRRPIFSIRPKATFNSLTNRAHIEMIDYWLKAGNNDVFYEIVFAGTLTAGGGAATWTSVAASSVVEQNTDADAISGGVVVESGVVTSSASSRGSTSNKDLDLRDPLVLSQIDSLTATQYALTLVVTSYTSTSVCTGGFLWHEKVI